MQFRAGRHKGNGGDGQAQAVSRPNCSRRPLKGAQPVVRVTTRRCCQLKNTAAAYHHISVVLCAAAAAVL